MADLDKPLTRLLIDLCHSDTLLDDFRRDPNAVLRQRNLHLHPRLKGALTLDDIHQAVLEEQEGDDVFVSLWILVGKLPLPTPWIIASPPGDPDSGEPEDTEPKSGGHGPGFGGDIEPR